MVYSVDAADLTLVIIVLTKLNLDKLLDGSNPKFFFTVLELLVLQQLLEIELFRLELTQTLMEKLIIIIFLENVQDRRIEQLLNYFQLILSLFLE